MYQFNSKKQKLHKRFKYKNRKNCFFFLLFHVLGIQICLEHRFNPKDKCFIVKNLWDIRNGDFVANSRGRKSKKQNINDLKADKQKEPIKDFSQTKDIVKALSGEIGPLVDQLLGAVYNVEVAENFADSLIQIYKKLRDEGITKTTAEKILCEYSSNVDRFASMLKKKE